MLFEQALPLLRSGKSARRKAWSGKKFIRLAESGHDGMTLPFFYMTTDDGHRCPWVAKQRDLIEGDWEILDDSRRSRLGRKPVLSKGSKVTVRRFTTV